MKGFEVMQGLKNASRQAAMLAIMAAAILHAPPAGAQEIDPSTIEAMTGNWLVAPADGAPGCVLKLTKEGAIGGFALEGAEHCANALPALADAAAWNFGDNAQILFLDPLRKVLMHFEEVEASPYRSVEKPALQMLFDPPAGTDRIPTAAALAGPWMLKRPGGETLCTVVLGKEQADIDTYPASPTGDCAATVRKLKLFRYQLNGLSLSLLGEDGSSLLFEETAPGRFEKAKEEGGKPLLMEKAR